MKRFIMALSAFVLLLGSSSAWATLDNAKIYKKAFGLDKAPKCGVCHADKMPKKEDGKHDLNEYGKKLNEAKGSKEELDEEAIKTVGKNEEAGAE